MSDVTTTCLRCGAPCRVRGPGREEATLLRLSATPDGFCASCAATQFIKLDYHFEGGLRERFDADPFILLRPEWQECFAGLLALGHSDADPAEVDWPWVVAHWTEPFPKRRKPQRKLKAKPQHNPTQLGLL
ncbi:MAG: hypothetical protein M3256_17855 [Actinomycetota bacterium]|nr:hypothetical protein [Actinomycetota bacterium]